MWIPRDPRDWSQEHVSHWLGWAIREFSLGSGQHIDSFISSLSMSGRQLCSMNKQDFISRAPLFMGDILWAHLEILQRETDPAHAEIKSPIVSSQSYYPALPQHPLPPSVASKTYTDLSVTKVSSAPSYPSYPPPHPSYYSTYSSPYNWMAPPPSAAAPAANEYLSCLPPLWRTRLH